MLKFKKKSVPGPTFFSLLNELPGDPCTFQLKLACQYGGICKVPGLFGYYLLSSPDYIEHALKSHHKNYIKTDLAYRGMASVLGQGLLPNPDHDDWLIQRRHLQPLFHPEALERLTTITTASTLALCDRWKNIAKQNTPIDLFQEMMTLVFEIAAKTLCSGEFVQESEQFLRYGELGNAYITKCLFLFPWLPTSHNIKFKKSKKITEQFIRAAINKRKTHPSLQQDLFSILQDLPEHRIIDEIKTFLMTGSETSGTALAWTWYQLITHPEINQQLQNAPDTHYARMVFEESLRVYPVVWMISRRAVNDDEINGYKIPAGATIIVSPYAMHNHPNYWEQPEIFNPLRFTEENKKTRPKFIYLPFGAGPRTCIGGTYALTQAQIILSIIAKHYEFELINKQPPKLEHLITLRPKGGVKVRIRKR